MRGGMSFEHVLLERTATYRINEETCQNGIELSGLWLVFIDVVVAVNFFKIA